MVTSLSPLLPIPLLPSLSPPPYPYPPLLHPLSLLPLTPPPLLSIPSSPPPYPLSSPDGTALIWDPETGSPFLKYTGHSGAVNCISFHQKEVLACTVSGDCLGHVWRYLPVVSGIPRQPNPVVRVAMCTTCGSGDMVRVMCALLITVVNDLLITR